MNLWLVMRAENSFESEKFNDVAREGWMWGNLFFYESDSYFSRYFS